MNELFDAVLASQFITLSPMYVGLNFGGLAPHSALLIIRGQDA